MMYIVDAEAFDFEPYPIPYCCFYSRNNNNLFMAGRDISCTHVALGSVRVIRTCGMMGEVVGMAASVCLTRGSAISIIAPKRSEKTSNGSVSIENTPVENRCSCEAYSVRLISTIWKASMTSPSLMSL